MDKLKSKMASVKSAKRKLLRLRSLLSRHKDSGVKTYTTSATTSTCLENDVINEIITGKMSMMSRFIRDVETNASKASQSNEEDRKPLTRIANRTFVIMPELDTAFVSDTSDYDSSDESVLNDGMIQDYVSEYESESAFGDDSECSSVCELERNVNDDVDVTDISLRNLRSMFGDRTLAVGVCDTELDSFMHTVVEIGNQSDEGISFAGSD